ncbi:MAG: AAA family ATPase, partial [Candidatus Aminicenantes bacterium]
EAVRRKPYSVILLDEIEKAHPDVFNILLQIFDEGRLTEAVRRKPYSVILLDEIEKAHPDVFNILLQILDDGRLTDGKGRTVDFKNTIIIMTSNLGSQVIKELSRDFETMEKKVREILESYFRPEFLNRVDEITIFRALSSEIILKIVDLQVDELRKRLQEKKIEIKLSEQAKKLLAERGYDPIFGARPLKRTIQRDIQNPLALKILEREYEEGDTVKVGVNNKKEFVFSKKSVKKE